MRIMTAEEAAEAYMSFDDWKYADREASWKWMFERGQESQREVEPTIRARCCGRWSKW